MLWVPLINSLINIPISKPLKLLLLTVYTCDFIPHWMGIWGENSGRLNKLSEEKLLLQSTASAGDALEIKS